MGEARRRFARKPIGLALAIALLAALLFVVVEFPSERGQPEPAEAPAAGKEPVSEAATPVALPPVGKTLEEEPAESAERLDAGEPAMDQEAVAEPSYIGVLLDAQGRAVPNALVSLSKSRRDFLSDLTIRQAYGPDPEELEDTGATVRLERFEARTDAGGAFKLESPSFRVAGDRSAQGSVAIWTEDGDVHILTLPPVKKGECKGNIVLRLAVMDRIWVEFRNPDGSRIPIDQLRSRLEPHVSLGVASIWAVDAARRRSIGFPAGVGEDATAFRFGVPASTIETLEVYVRGAGAVTRSVKGLADGSRVEFVVPYPDTGHPLHLRLRWEEVGGPERTTKSFGVRACLATPEHEVWNRCCGLGGGVGSSSDAPPPLDLEIRVRSPRPYWVSVRPQYKDSPVRYFGPFLPGPAVHEMFVDDIEPFVFVPRRWSRQEVLPTGSLIVEVRDASTGEPVRAHLTDVEDLTASTDEERSRRQRWIRRTGGEAPILIASLPVGSFTARIGAHGYASTGPLSFEISSERARRLEPVSLHPQPWFQAQLLEADGAPVAPGTLVTVWGPDGKRLLRIRTGQEGWISAPAPEGVPLRFVVKHEAILVDEWCPEDPLRLLLAPRHRVLVRVLGVDAMDAEVHLALWARRVGGEEDEFCYERKHGLLCCKAEGRRLADPGSRFRTYEFRLAPGRYRVTGSGVMYQIDEADIEVPRHAGLVDLELRAHGR